MTPEQDGPSGGTAVRRLYLGASALAFSVAADSSLEHYRGGFYNRVMYVGPTVSALTLLASLGAGRAQSAPPY